MSPAPKAQPKPIFYDENKHHKQYNFRHRFNYMSRIDDMADDVAADMEMTWMAMITCNLTWQ